MYITEVLSKSGCLDSNTILNDRKCILAMSLQNLNISQEHIHRFCRQYQVRELALFGSVLRDDFDSDSDIDLLIDFKPDAQVGFLTLSRMQRELSILFQRPVDLVPKAGLKPIIRQEVLSNAQVLYASRETVSY